jgi:hypothetical protein
MWDYLLCLRMGVYQYGFSPATWGKRLLLVAKFRRHCLHLYRMLTDRPPNRSSGSSTGRRASREIS